MKPFVIVTVAALSGLAANVFHDMIPPFAHRPGLAQRLGFAWYFLWFVSLSLWIATSAGQTDVPNRRTGRFPQLAHL